jgi:hypothetical protein
MHVCPNCCLSSFFFFLPNANALVQITINHIVEFNGESSTAYTTCRATGICKVSAVALEDQEDDSIGDGLISGVFVEHLTCEGVPVCSAYKNYVAKVTFVVPNGLFMLLKSKLARFFAVSKNDGCNPTTITNVDTTQTSEVDICFINKIPSSPWTAPTKQTAWPTANPAAWPT